MTPAEFRDRFGHEPTLDDLHRVDCDLAGDVGHMHCGICSDHDKPRFMCGCLLLPYLSQLNAEVIEVAHSSLRRSGESDYRSRCPVCKVGILLVYRSEVTFALNRYDRCTRCAQTVRYTDVEIAGEKIEG